MTDEIDIETSAAGPKRISVDGQSVEEHPLKDQIAADNRVKAAAAQTSNKCPVRFVRQAPPSARGI